jgi:Leucine-rich repeat (LRR) protein
LTYLRLDQNRLAGYIPTEVGNLQSLTVLYFQTNDLTGSVPSEIGRLTQLTDLRLHENKITGTIPVELEMLTKLESLGLYDTDLIGNLDPVFCSDRLFPFFQFFADCSGSPPEITCTCCTHCCNADATNCEENS